MGAAGKVDAVAVGDAVGVDDIGVVADVVGVI